MKRILALFLLVITLCIPAGAAELGETMAQTAAHVHKTVAQPMVGTIGGEWAVLGLARSGYAVPEGYYQGYYAAVEQAVRDGGGVLHRVKYTEYSRVILALSALGRDARSVAGYDLTLPLGDYDKTIWQGLNGPVWALIALDSADYPMPQNPEAKTQATRQMYVERILTSQKADGGWSLGEASEPEPDMTGMALQALAGYRDQAAVKTAVERALGWLSAHQDPDGGYASWETSNTESVVQVLVALTQLGVPLDDARFVKNGKTVLDNLLSYRQKDGSFRHTGSGDGANQMATEQGLYALAAAQRAADGRSRLYDMSDALAIGVAPAPTAGQGLDGKHEDVKSMAVTLPGAAFPDLTDSGVEAAVLALAQRGIVEGKDGGRFDPNGQMTRAEFATIIVKALGLKAEGSHTFNDVPHGAWYAASVATASGYGIVTGVGDGRFHPLGTISRQEAAVMVARGAKLCGLSTDLDETAAQNVLAQFGDYTQSAVWARSALAFCYDTGILDPNDAEIAPNLDVTRGQVAEMLFRLLERANLLA